MKGRRKYQKGFTIIELIVIIVVLGILATLTTLGLRQYLTQSDDAQRKASATVIAEALEKYHAKYGEYPSCTALIADGPTVTSNNGPLSGLDGATIVVPGAPAGESNSIRCVAIDSNNSDDYFGYAATGCSANACLGYTLQYRQLQTNTINDIKSRYQAQLGDCGPQLTLNSSSVQFTRITATWNAATAPCTDYRLQVDTTSAFNSGNLQTFNLSNVTSYQVTTNLSSGVVYYLRVAPVLSGVPGYWSNTISRTTLTLPVSGISGVANSATQITVSWTATTSPATASSYNLRYSTSSSMTSPTAVNTISGTSQAVSSLTAGSTYYFQVQANATSPQAFTGAWSPTTPVAVIAGANPPASCTATTSGNRTINVSWSASAGASSYRTEQSTSSSFTSVSAKTGLTTTSTSYTSLNNATTYYTRVRAVTGTYNSAWTNCTTRTTGIDGPTGVGWSAEGIAVRNSDSIPWMPGEYPGGGNWWSAGMNIYGTCSPGATVVTRLYAYYAYSNNTSPNNAVLLDWTWGNERRFMENGNDSWYIWWQGWVACQAGSTRVGDTYLGNAGPY